MSALDEIVAQVRAWDDSRERSQQVEIGWSGVAGCRRKMGYILAEEWHTDDPDPWQAIRGTGLHIWMQGVREEAFRRQAAGRIARFEVAVKYGGILGHADEVVYFHDADGTAHATVTDYKFPALRSAGRWADPHVLDERFIQPNGYAAGVIDQSDQLLDENVTVRLLVAPVDGTFADWRLFERPFDRRVADLALDRVIEVEAMLGQGQELPRDKPAWFCASWCEFASICRPDEFADVDLPEIEDVELAAAVEAYGEAKETELAATKIIEEIAPLIRGLRGTARGWRVTTGKAQMDMRPDMDAIRADYEASGLVVPERSMPKSPALRVTRVKS